MKRTIAVAMFTLACGGHAEPEAVAAAPTTVATVAPPSTPIAAPPTSAAPVTAWPTVPTTADVGGGCTTGTPITITSERHDLGLVATPTGALLAYDGPEHTTVQPLDGGGATAGPAIEVAGAGAMIGLARLGDGVVLVRRAPIEGDWHHDLLTATPLDATGHPVGDAATHEVSRDALGGWLYGAADGGAVWVVAGWSTSHSGHGLMAGRIARDPSGALTVDALRRFADTLPDGSEDTGLRVFAAADDLLLLFGSHCEQCGGDDFDQPRSVRYLGRYSTTTTAELGDLGNVVHDLVLDADQVHVLFDRGADYFTARIASRDGRVDAITPLDRSQPFPAPFGARLLVEYAGREGHQEQVLHDASGRRLGDPVPSGTIAWTGHGFLVASSTAPLTVTPVACRAADAH